MAKARALRITGFFGALCASAALVGVAASGTGAYFTDSKSGAINVGTGHIKVDVDPGDLQLSFAQLLPGESQTKTINYTAHPSGSSAEDIWLVFPTTGDADAFLGNPHLGPNPLGRYGHLKIASTGGATFESNNLALDPGNGGSDPGGYNTAASCHIDFNGSGGSPDAAADKTSIVNYCAPRPAILLQSGMHDGDGGHVNIDFGFTKLLTNGTGNSNEDGPQAPLVKFSIVATQSGVSPSDVNNG